MLNKAKLQIELFKNLVYRTRTVAYCKGDQEVYFTMDGYTAFSLPEMDVCLDLGKMQMLESMKELFVISEKDQEVSKIKTIRELRMGEFCYEMKCDQFSVFAKKTLFDKYYDNHRLFCESPELPIKLVSNVTGKVEALVLPVRIRESE